jgi:hypothetical protein
MSAANAAAIPDGAVPVVDSNRLPTAGRVYELDTKENYQYYNCDSTPLLDLISMLNI